MLSKFASFLFVTVLVISGLLMLIFVQERMDNSAIAGHATSYGPKCTVETDAGTDVSRFGGIYVPSVDVTMNDVCVDSDTISEFECAPQGVVRTYFSCNSVGLSCQSGACVSSDDSRVHVVLMIDDGFAPEVLTIQSGDTVTWVNVREKIDSALLIGAQKNTHIRSEMLGVGESFSYTFSDEELGKNVFVDGILISYDQWIYVE